MLTTTKIKRGQIYFAELPAGYGSEQDGLRPVLIIQNDTGNRYSPTTLVAPLTTSKMQKRLPTHVFLEACQSNLKYDSKVLLEQIRVIDKARLQSLITYLGESKMLEVDAAISVSFGLSAA